MRNSLEKHPAFRYLDLSWPTIPTLGKRPLIKWKEYQSRAPTCGEWKIWAARWPASNCALILGPVSGLACLDVDGPGGLYWALRRGRLPHGPTVATPRGWRRICLAPDPPRASWTRTGPGWSVSLLLDRALAILPPGVHPSGISYTWQAKMGPEEVVPGTLSPHWWSPPSEETERLSTDLPSPPTSRHVPLESGGPIPIGRRNDTLFRVACRLVRAGHPRDSVGDRLRSLNQMCARPLTAGELGRIVRASDRYRAP